jgi:CDGSH-type Zn-finger protein
MSQQATDKPRPSTRKAKPHIRIEEQGPYEVTGDVKLTRRIRVSNAEGERIGWQEGEDYTVDSPSYDLCRCGHSENKPFCDGHHEKVEWDGTLTADRAPSETRRQVYEGKGIVMTDDESLCAGYEFCDRFNGVWNEIRHTADPQLREQLEHQIGLCPSGRLQFKRTRQGEPIEVHYEPTIAAVPDGPLWVLGGIEVEGPDGTTYEVRNRQLLCRCGESKNKPFCDGTHWNTNFKAP